MMMMINRVQTPAEIKFISLPVFRLAVKATLLAIQFVLMFITFTGKSLEHEADYSLLSSAVIRNERSFTSISAYVFIVWCIGTETFVPKRGGK
jgi:hypothetical protein